ncbi:MAG: hypothetical protein AABY64_12725 [Bdellovibrionota bacterium]
MGKNLAQDLSLNSGLDEDLFNTEFDKLLEKYGKSAQQITLPELREILAQELQDVLLEMKDSSEEFSDETPQSYKFKSN